MLNRLRKLISGKEDVPMSVNVTLNFSAEDVKAIRIAKGEEVTRKLLEELVYTSVDDDLEVMYRILENHGIYRNVDRYDEVKAQGNMN